VRDCEGSHPLKDWAAVPGRKYSLGDARLGAEVAERDPIAGAASDVYAGTSSRNNEARQEETNWRAMGMKNRALKVGSI